MEEKKDNNKTFSIIIIVLLIIILILSLILITYRTKLFTKASGNLSGNIQTPQTVSNYTITNSYVFASPLRARSGGEKIRITVFVLDGKGMGVSGVKTSVGSLGSLVTSVVIQDTTDDQGRATFDVSSDTPGVYLIQASVEGKPLDQKVTVSFD